MTAQPKWKTISKTDDELVQVDETGVYPPEMEVAQENYTGRDDDDGRYQVYRFALDRLKWVKGYLVTERYQPDWPHPVHMYQEWFTDSLPAIAESVGMPETELTELLCSEDPMARAHAYSAIGSYHGFANLDSYPLDLTETELNNRWEK